MDDYFLSLANELISRYQRIKNFTPHALSTGKYHEEALKSVLKLFLPDRFSIKTGFVFIPKEKAVSRESDLIIIDENEPNSYFFKDGDFVVVHPEAVVCVIEVKTKIDKHEFQKIHMASKALAGVRDKQQDGRKSCMYLAFSYDSVRISNDEQLGKWYKDLPLKNGEEYMSTDYPAAIVSLMGDIGVLQLIIDKDEDLYYVRKIYKETQKSPEWNLAVFLMAVRTLTDLRAGKNSLSNPDWGVNFEGAKLSRNHFKAGEGLQRN